MNAKILLRSILLVFALGSVAIWALREYRKSVEIGPLAQTSGDSLSLPSVAGNQVFMTYFRSGVRCTSCKKIELLTREAAIKDLAGEISSGKLVFRVIDTDLPADHHFIKDYQLTGKTVILSFRRDGRELRWTSMERIWELLDEPAAFRSYLTEPVIRYLGS